MGGGGRDHQVFGLDSHFDPIGAIHGVVAFHDQPQQQNLSPVPERRSTGEEGEHDDPAGPGIHLEPVAITVSLE